MDIRKNTVSAEGQVHKDHFTEVFNNDGNIKVLFIGNSITRHEPKPEIGWPYDWGMSASKLENDYVHVAVRMLEEKYGKVDYCITNCGQWELNYKKGDIFDEWKIARDFQADIVVARIGENVAPETEPFERHPFITPYLKMVEYFSSNPKAKVVATGLFWKSDQMETAVEQAAKEGNYPFVRLNDLGMNNENMAIGQFAHQGVAMHPNDLGMRRIAERIVEKIIEIDKI